MDRAYHFSICVKSPDGARRLENHTVSESGTQFGESLALGKVVSFYESLKERGEITEYRIMAE